MSTDRATGIESTGPTDEESSSQLNQLLRRVDALEAENDQLHSELEATQEQQREDCHALARENHELRASNEQLEERADQAEAERDELNEQIPDLESQLADARDHTGREFATVRARMTDTENTVEEFEEQITELEGGFADVTPRVEEGKTGSQDTETPLERICQLPEHLADRELTANQERARFIASDVQDYAEKCPAGLVIDSRAIKRVITASEGKRPHTQTVTRVINFLDDLGKNAVELKKRRGRKLVVFDPEVV